MTNQTFDTITRRASMATLGGAGAVLAATFASPDVGVAKKRKKRKKAKKACKRKERKRCSNDAAACRAELVTQAPLVCGGDTACIAQVTACCDECSADGFLNCVVLSITSASSMALG